MRPALVSLALLFAHPSWADFVTFTKDADIHEYPAAYSRVLMRAQSGDMAELVSRRSEGGFYLVRFGEADGEIGYVYRRSFRAQRGDPGFVSRRAATGPASEATSNSSTSPAGRGAGLQPDGTFDGCPLVGNVSPNAPHHDQLVTLNKNKNRYDSPSPTQIDSSITLSSLLAPGEDSARFKVGQAVRIRGYVHDAKVGGVETGNCKATAHPERDTHIELVLGPADNGPSRRVIVEVTPRIRALAAKKGIDWSTETLQRDIIGHTITVTGWLLFDTEHQNQAENTAPGNPSNWRATVWEVHPVTVLELTPAPLGALASAPQ